MLFSEEEYKNGVAQFFGALNAFAELFGEALDNYVKEDYDKVNTPDEQQQEEENSSHCDCECCDECCCGDSAEEVDEKTEVDEDINECGDPGPAEEYDSYKITVSNYNVKSYEEALEIMKPKLNDLTFAMRTFTFGEAALEFRFPNVTYKFFWDKDSDMFIGLEDTTVLTKEVFWDEIDGQVKDLTDENVNAHKNDVNQNPEDAIKPCGESVQGNECIYKNNSFYPYGKKCENCPERDKCYTPETEATDETESHSATYDADGNAIADEEIPSLKDYTGERKTVEETPGYDSGYGDLVGCHEQKTEIPTTQGATQPKLKTTITGKSLFDKVNKNYISVEQNLIDVALIGVTKILNEDTYDIGKFENGKIVSIKFSLNWILANMPSGVIAGDLKKSISLHNLSNAIKEHFEFAKVEIKNDIVNCYLV